MDSPKDQDTDTVVLANNNAPPLEGGQSIKIGGMWKFKHNTSSQKFYEILTKTGLKGYTALYILFQSYQYVSYKMTRLQKDLLTAYQSNMYLNVVTRIQEDLLTAYQSIKRHYKSQ